MAANTTSKLTLRGCAALLMAAALLLAALVADVQAGNKGNKGKSEDIILYNGHIVMRGDKKGGSIVLANQHPHHEEVEFAPSFFTGDRFGEMGGFRRRR